MADSAQGLQLRELKDTISELNKLIKTLQQTVEAVSICIFQPNSITVPKGRHAIPL